MKPSLRPLLPLLGLAAALPAFAADSSSATRVQDAQKDIKARTEIQNKLRVLGATDGAGGTRRVVGVRRPGEPGEMETVTFLGVETAPVSATLSAQLGLNPGSGLVIAHVSPNTPAAGALKQHDILLKFDDQILIEQRQLSVLVRGRKEGDEVTLTYLRAGKQETAKVKLAKHDVPKISAVFTAPLPNGGALFGQNGAYAYTFNGSGNGSGDVAWQEMPADVLTNREDVNRVLSLIDAAKAPGQRRISIASAPGSGQGTVSVTVDTGNSQISSSDEQGSLEVTIKDGQKQLVAKNAAGEQIFAGPVNTAEERKALPAEVRERLDKLENMHQFSFSADADFQGAQTKLFRAPAQGISLPRPPQPPAGARRTPALFF